MPITYTLRSHRPRCYRAKKLAKAYARVIIKPQALFQMSKISVETYIVGKKIELSIIFDGEEHVIVSTAP